MISCDYMYAPSKSKLHACDLVILTQEETERVYSQMQKVYSPGKGLLPNAVPLNSLHGVPAPKIPIPVSSCNESPGCYIGKSISLYSSKGSSQNFTVCFLLFNLFLVSFCCFSMETHKSHFCPSPTCTHSIQAM